MSSDNDQCDEHDEEKKLWCKWYKRVNDVNDVKVMIFNCKTQLNLVMNMQCKTL